MTDMADRMMPRRSPEATENGHRPLLSQGTSLTTRRRPKGYAALAVALIVGFGALGYWFYTQAGAKVPVVIATRDIPAGHKIDRSYLSTVEVAGGVTAVGGNHLSSLVGQTATVEILRDSLVQRSMVTSGADLRSGQGLVGVATDPGQIPSSGLVPGDHVEVVQLPDKGATSTAAHEPSAAVLASSAVVYDVRANPAAAGGTLLTLVVPTSTALGISQASNAGLIALVRVGG